MLTINRLVKQVFAILLLIAPLSIPINAYANDQIKIISYTDYPPYLHHENGQQTGLYLRIVELTFKAIDQAYTVETLPINRGIYQAASGDGIIIGIMKTDERIEILDFSEPFYQERVSVFFNKQQVPPIKTVDKLDGLVIGKLLGWSYGYEFDHAKKNNRFITKNNELESNFSMLAKGRLDAVIHTELSAAYVLNKLGLQDEVFLGSEPLELGDIYIAAKKGSQKKLLDRINLKLNEPDHIKKMNILIRSYKQ
jgi:polar amino acid transport system substrate-binding protein